MTGELLPGGVSEGELRAHVHKVLASRVPGPVDTDDLTQEVLLAYFQYGKDREVTSWQGLASHLALKAVQKSWLAVAQLPKQLADPSQVPAPPDSTEEGPSEEELDRHPIWRHLRGLRLGKAGRRLVRAILRGTEGIPRLAAASGLRPRQVERWLEKISKFLGEQGLDVPSQDT